MKNKWIKRFLIISLTGLLAGGICMGAGIAMGGSPMFYVNAEGIHVKENQNPEDSADYRMDSTETGALQNIRIDMAEADIRIVSGEQFLAEYVLDGQRLSPEYSVSGGTLILAENSEWKSSAGFGFFVEAWGDREESATPYVQITIPKNAVLSDVTLSNQYGDIYMDSNLKAENLSVYAENGDVCMEDWSGSSFELEMDYGEFSGGSLSGKKVDIENGNGNVSVGGLKADAAEIELEYGELEAVLEKPGSVSIRNENGDISLFLNGAEKEYGLELYTEYGVISMPQKTIKPDETGEYSGASYKEPSAGQAGLYAETEYGKISVREIKR